MRLFEIILLVSLVVCAVSVGFARDLLTSIVIFMSYSLIMCVIWILLQSPDLAITEAAVGGRGHQHPVFHYIEENQGHKQGSR